MEVHPSDIGENSADRAYLLHLGWSIVRDHAIAEDAVQTAFAKFLEQPNGSVRSTRDWLARVVVNECLQAKRRQKVEQRAVNRQPRDLWEHDGPVQRALRAEQIELLRRSIEQLPASQADVVRLRLQEGWTFAEIAERMDLPLGTVLTRMRNAMQTLRGLLHELED